MMSTATNHTVGSRSLIRLGAAALALSGLLFFLYPAVRPWHDESTVGGAVASMSSSAWVAAHLFAMLALILMPLGLLALCLCFAGSRGFGLAVGGTVAAWLGAGLALPYYGAEDFALHAIARDVSSGTPIDLLRLVQAIRFGPVAASTFAIGLGLLGAGGVLIAIAIWRAAILPRPTGVLLAVPLILLIPQFYLPAWTRIAHGGLLALALIWLAVALWTAAARQDRGSYSDRSSETSFVTSAL
jgi:hypothetical protein